MQSFLSVNLRVTEQKPPNNALSIIIAESQTVIISPLKSTFSNKIRSTKYRLRLVYSKQFLPFGPHLKLHVYQSLVG